MGGHTQPPTQPRGSTWARTPTSAEVPPPSRTQPPPRITNRANQSINPRRAGQSAHGRCAPPTGSRPSPLRAFHPGAAHPTSPSPGGRRALWSWTNGRRMGAHDEARSAAADVRSNKIYEASCVIHSPAARVGAAIGDRAAENRAARNSGVSHGSQPDALRAGRASRRPSAASTAQRSSQRVSARLTIASRGGESQALSSRARLADASTIASCVINPVGFYSPTVVTVVLVVVRSPRSPPRREGCEA